MSEPESHALRSDGGASPAADSSSDEHSNADGSSARGGSVDDSSINPSSADRPPGPRGLPIIGSTLSIARDPLAFLESAKEYGDIVSYSAYGTDFALVYDPHVVEAVLVSRSDEFDKGEFETDFGELIAPDGIAFTEGERWRRQRTLLQSSFTPDRIRAVADGMVAEADALVDGWEDGDVVSLRDGLATYSVRVLARTL